MKWIKNILTVGVILVFCTVTINYQYQILNTLIANGRQLDIMKYYQEFKLLELENKLRDVINEQLIRSRRDLEDNERRIEIEDSISKLENLQRKTEESLKNDYVAVDTKNIHKLIGSNVLLYNLTAGCLGSGTHVKIDNKHYILTCAHLIKEPTDNLVIRMEDGENYPIEYINHNRYHDLALFRIHVTKVTNLPYVEIAERAPDVGSQVLIIGNPAGNINVVTSGTIAKLYPYAYLMTNLIYSGNSGGGIFYRNKLVGVATQIRIYSRAGYIFVNYSYGTDLKAIQWFLEESI